jgi:hypothetical protein
MYSVVQSDDNIGILNYDLVGICNCPSQTLQAPAQQQTQSNGNSVMFGSPESVNQVRACVMTAIGPCRNPPAYSSGGHSNLVNLELTQTHSLTIQSS